MLTRRFAVVVVGGCVYMSNKVSGFVSRGDLILVPLKRRRDGENVAIFDDFDVRSTSTLRWVIKGACNDVQHSYRVQLGKIQWRGYERKTNVGQKNQIGGENDHDSKATCNWNTRGSGYTA